MNITWSLMSVKLPTNLASQQLYINAICDYLVIFQGSQTPTQLCEWITPAPD